MSQAQESRDSSAPDQSFFHFAPYPMWIYDIRTLEFLAVNRQATQQYGYAESEFLQMTIKDIRPEDDIPRLEKAVAAVRSSINPYSQSMFRHRKKDGSIMHVEIKGSLIEYKGRRAEIVSAIDLSPQYKQQETIDLQNNYLAITSRIHELFIQSTELDKTVHECFHLLGASLDVDRCSWYDFTNHDTSAVPSVVWTEADAKSGKAHFGTQKFADLDVQALSETFGAALSVLTLTKDSREYPLLQPLLSDKSKSILAAPVATNGVFQGVVAIEQFQWSEWNQHDAQLMSVISSNITFKLQQKMATQRLLDSEAKFKSLVQNGSDMIAILSHDAVYKYVAPASEKVLGIAPEEFIGKNAFELINEEDRPMIRRFQEDILKTDRVSFGPYRFINKAGGWRWLETVLTNHLEDPNINGIVANTRDVTSKVRKREVKVLIAAMTKAIGQPGSKVKCFDDALSNILDVPGIQAAEIWLVSEDNSSINQIAKTHHGDRFQQFYDRTSDNNSFAMNEGLPGKIWQAGEQVVWDGIMQRPEFLRSKAAQDVGFSTAIGTPLFYNDEFLGSLVCFSSLKRAELAEQIALIREVGNELGPVFIQKITEEEYRNFFEISPDPHCVIGYDGRIKKMNQAFPNMLGYEHEELLNSIVMDLIHELDREEAVDKLSASVAKNESLPFEGRFVTKTGTIKWLTWTGTAMPESKVILAVAKDITVQKMATEALHESNEKLQYAQRIAKIGYWRRKLSEDVSEWSEETYKIHGYSPDEFTPTWENVWNTLHPDDRHLLQQDPSTVAPNKTHSVTHRIITSKGETKWVHREAVLKTDDNGHPLYLDGTIQDITEQKERETALAISNERFELAIRASNDIIWEIDHLKNQVSRSSNEDGALVYKMNEAFEAKNSIFSKIHSDDQKKVWDSFNEAIKNPERSSWQEEYRIMVGTGEVRYYIDRAYILRNEQGAAIRSIGSLSDVTESRQQLEFIKQQNDVLRQIAWKQSHEVRAPLARILSIIQYITSNQPDEAEMNAMFGHLIASSNELDAIIREITSQSYAISDYKA